MDKNFSDKVVLTSQYPGTFLVFTDDTSSLYDIDPSINTGNDYIYINGWPINNLINASGNFRISLSADVSLAPFYLYTTSKEDFDYTIRFISQKDASGSYTYYDVSIYNRPSTFSNQELNSYQTYEPLVDDITSYLLLRTNPSYSGNIKLVIDSSNNLYLDTFKISQILSNKKYRKQKVSGNSVLSGDVRNVFSTLPKGELFRISDEDTLDISKPKTEYVDQYDMTYSYGARLLKDELYDNDYSILAPIWINTKIPNYFSIFRLSGTFNPNTYGLESTIESNAVDYIKYGTIIKSWNLKDDAEVGTYLDNHLSELNNVQSPVNLSLGEYDPNTWYGIAVDKGIITGRSEIPYFFNQKSKNLTDINAFVSQGFSRNNLLCPNLLNLEFTFNDPDASIYSMHRYFGLYLTENELYKISYYADTIDGSVRRLSLDGRDSSTFIDSSIFSSTTGNVNTDFLNRIFVINDGTNLTRISNISDFCGNTDITSEYVNKLGNNIVNTKVEPLDINQFLSFRVENLLSQGEHLRIVSKSQNKIWEVYGSDNDIYKEGDAGEYAIYESSIGYPTIYRTVFSVKGEINDQIGAIEKAFGIFNNYGNAPFRVGKNKGNSLSILFNDNYKEEFYFQRITANTLVTPTDPSSVFSSAANWGDISFYNTMTPSESDFNRIGYDSSYGPIGFEIYGDRYSLMLNILDSSSYYVYSFDSSKGEDFTDYVLYPASNGYNYLLKEFDISTGVIYTSKYVEDPTSTGNNAIIITEFPISLEKDNIWQAYDVFPISISLMGINPVKDFDSIVYDTSTGDMNFKSEYWYKRDGDVSTYSYELSAGNKYTINHRDTFEITSGKGWLTLDGGVTNFSSYYATDSSIFYFNTYFNTVTVNATTDTRITYNSAVDGSYAYISYDPSISEELLYDYYSDNYFYIDPSSGETFKNKKNLKYGLTVPTISKWSLTGKDCRNNKVRLNLTSSFYETTTVNSNFVPYLTYFDNEIGYPVFKYLSSGENNWEDYIYYDIYDVLDYSGSKSSLKELIFSEPYIDVFSKIMYANHSVNDRVTRSSILYYDIYNKRVTTVSKGLKLSFKTTETGQKKFNTIKWDKYRFSLLTTPSKNKDHNEPIEVIINENTKTVLMIWYQGNDLLHYSRKNSSFLPGHNNLWDKMNTSEETLYGIGATDVSSSYIKTPFRVNTAAIIPSASNIFGIETDYDSSISSKFLQYNYNTADGLNSVFSAQNTNNVSNSVFNFKLSFNTFDQSSVEYTYTPSNISYGSNIINSGYSFLNNYNYYSDKTSALSVLGYFIGLNYIHYSIISGTTLYTNDNFSVPPISCSIQSPIPYRSVAGDSSIYTFSGYYTPIFNDILKFSANESYTLMNIVEKDFILNNTNVTSNNNIEQLWANKVVSAISTQDTSNNIVYKSGFNPFLSSWDASYYMLDYTSASSRTYIDGFKSSDELPSFFGSKLIKFPDQLILEKWNNNNSNIKTLANNYILEYNLTQSVIDLFSDSVTFLSNWSNIPGVTDDDVNEYIIKAVLDYYNISISKINVDLWYKPFSNSVIAYTLDSGFNNKLKNIKSSFYYEKNQYIYKIRVPISDNRTYFTKFTFNKK